MQTGKWAKYDYGAKKNMQVYGSKEPPEYNIADIDPRYVPHTPPPGHSTPLLATTLTPCYQYLIVLPWRYSLEGKIS